MSVLFLQCSNGAARIVKCSCSFAAATNENDLEIAKSICWAIACVVACLVVGFLAWKLIDHIANGISGWNKRQWDIKDRERKQKADLLEKKLQILYELCKEEEPKKGFKKVDSMEMKTYLETLGVILEPTVTKPDAKG